MQRFQCAPISKRSTVVLEALELLENVVSLQHSILDGELLETYVSGQPLLLSLACCLLFLTVLSFTLAGGLRWNWASAISPV